MAGSTWRRLPLTIDRGWRDVAQACLDWLYKNSL
jgi:hypothetical protein